MTRMAKLLIPILHSRPDAFNHPRCRSCQISANDQEMLIYRNQEQILCSKRISVSRYEIEWLELLANLMEVTDE